MASSAGFGIFGFPTYTDENGLQTSSSESSFPLLSLGVRVTDLWADFDLDQVLVGASIELAPGATTGLLLLTARPLSGAEFALLAAGATREDLSLTCGFGRNITGVLLPGDLLRFLARLASSLRFLRGGRGLDAPWLRALFPACTFARCACGLVVELPVR